MSKLVILRIERGDFNLGFPVKLEIRENGKLCGIGEVAGKLAPAPEISELYKGWQQEYYAWGERFRWWGGNSEASISQNHATRQISVPPNIVTNSPSDNHDLADQLETAFNDWLDCSSLGEIRDELLQTVKRDEEVRFIIQTDRDNLELQKLPWELWHWLRRRYNHPEVALSSRRVPEKGALSIPVKILVILGSDENIDTQVDKKIIQNSLLGAQIEALEKPSLRELSQTLESQPWDIIFFAGHSSTQKGGTDARIWVNDQDYLSPRQLSISLETAVVNGLKLAIFNSCDGLGLARQLENLHIPHIIVMREPIHDRIAQKFLQATLEKFATGASLHESVREARKQLRLEEHRSPNASWLPVIFQNPEEPPLYYPKVRTQEVARLQINRRTKLLRVLGAIALALLGFVTAIAIHRFFIAPDASWATGISLGEEILFENPTHEKELGSQAFARGNYTEAKRYFKVSLNQKPNDPEARIYYNNARAADYRQKPLKIAVSIPIGSNLEVAQELLRGVALAQQEVNDDEEMLLQVAIANDNNDRQLAPKVATRFVKDKTIVAVVGHNASDASKAAKDIYKSGGLVAITPTSFSAAVQGEAYIFKMVPQMTYFAARLAYYIGEIFPQKNPSPKVTVCYDPEAPDNTDFKDRFLYALKANEVQYIEVSCEFKNPSFNSNTVVETIKKNHADSLMVAPHVDRIPEAVEVFKAVRENQLPIKLFGSPSFHSDKTIVLGKESVEGMILAVPYYLSEQDSFSVRSQQLWQAKTNTWRTPMAYDTAKVIIVGLQNVLEQKQAPIRQKLDDVLRSKTSTFKYKGVTETISFDPDTGERRFPNTQNQYGAVIQIKNGNFVRIQ